METTKLTLEHLSVYLPYGLSLKILNHKNDYIGIEYSKINGYYFIGESLHVTYDGSGTGKSIDEFKPILKPLSYYTDITGKHMNDLDADIPIMIEISDLAIKSIYHTSCSFSAIKTMAEAHIDIFRLTEKGLAINYFETI